MATVVYLLFVTKNYLKYLLSARKGLGRRRAAIEYINTFKHRSKRYILTMHVHMFM